MSEHGTDGAGSVSVAEEATSLGARRGDVAETRTTGVKLIAAWVAAALLLALYAYAVAAGIGNLLGMSAFLGDALGILPWVLLGFAIAAPVLALIVSLTVARGRSAWIRVLLLATGLCAAAAVQLEIMHLIS